MSRKLATAIVAISYIPGTSVRTNSFKEERNASSFSQTRYGNPYRLKHRGKGPFDPKPAGEAGDRRARQRSHLARRIMPQPPEAVGGGKRKLHRKRVRGCPANLSLPAETQDKTRDVAGAGLWETPMQFSKRLYRYKRSQRRRVPTMGLNGALIFPAQTR